jgi:hypothetical protein
MYIDVGAYTASKKTIINWLSTRDRKELRNDMSMIAVITSCPCIVVAYYTGEAFGWPEEVVAYIKRLIDFYGYDEIANKPEGSPI